MVEIMTLSHIFIDHSNMWGGARLASRVRTASIRDDLARVSVRVLDSLLGGEQQGTSTKIVAGGVPPGMDGLWDEYRTCGYDVQRLFRDENWRERGVDHSMIGHMWRLLTKYGNAPTRLVIASGDGKENEFGTSFREVIEEALKPKYPNWRVVLASFYWDPAAHDGIKSPTHREMLKLVTKNGRGEFINLFESYDKLVFHKPADYAGGGIPASPAARRRVPPSSSEPRRSSASQ